jgi:hypothetical protein
MVEYWIEMYPTWNRLKQPYCKVVAANENISDGIGIVQELHKMIKLADTSDLGCKVVQEYERNPIAYDSEDEKRTD